MNANRNAILFGSGHSTVAVGSAGIVSDMRTEFIKIGEACRAAFHPESRAFDLLD